LLAYSSQVLEQRAARVLKILGVARDEQSLGIGEHAVVPAWSVSFWSPQVSAPTSTLPPLPSLPARGLRVRARRHPTAS